jgi:DNA-binding NarL/FixJ family response regulator
MAHGAAGPDHRLTMTRAQITPGPAAAVPWRARAVRIAVVDDHPVVRVGLCDLLSDQPDFDVVGAATSYDEAVELATRESVDVAVVDYQLGRSTGLWLSHRLKRLPDPPGVVLYTGHGGGLLAAACVVAEADALVRKTAPAPELFGAIRAAAAGCSRLPLLADPVAEAARRRLRPDEQVIFGMLVAGFPRASIARHLRLPATELEARLRLMLGVLEDTRAAPACSDGIGRRVEQRPRRRRRSRG